MTEPSRYFLTTAIDYPNSRPHIGTAFEKLGADVQARYRRMEGYEVFFLMGNDENTVKVAKRAAELGVEPKAYCDDMAQQFQEVWRALEISYDDFIQTSDARHHEGCRKFIQKVYDNDYIYKGNYEGWYCEGCESFKTEKDLDENRRCPIHKTPAVRRVEPCHYFALSKFQDRLIRFYEENPDFIQPESRRNEVLNLVQTELRDVNITRSGQNWGIRVPFDPDFTIWVWFDALLNYITAIGYGTDEARFNKWWPAEPARHRQRHHALPLRPVAGDVHGRRHRAAAQRVRPRLRLHQERGDRTQREDQQDAGQRRRADGPHHEVQRRGVSLLLPRECPVPRRRRV